MMDALVRLDGVTNEGDLVDPILPSPPHTWAHAHLHGAVHL